MLTIPVLSLYLGVHNRYNQRLLEANKYTTAIESTKGSKPAKTPPDPVYKALFQHCTRYRDHAQTLNN